MQMLKIHGLVKNVVLTYFYILSNYAYEYKQTYINMSSVDIIFNKL